jgi:hypothetical protein
MLHKGTQVRVTITGAGLRASYPAADWLTGERVVTLIDDAPFGQTLDVIDVRLPDGSEQSVYDFNIRGPVLDTFTAAYLECALWLGRDERTGANENDPSVDLRERVDTCYGLTVLDPATLEQILEDCTAFQAEYGDLIADNLDRAGHDFYLTRNRHGAGFWDGDWSKDAGRTLTDASHPYGEFELVLDDEGVITGRG